MKKVLKSAVLLMAAIMLIVSAAVFPASAENAIISFNPSKPAAGQPQRPYFYKPVCKNQALCFYR